MNNYKIAVYFFLAFVILGGTLIILLNIFSLLDKHFSFNNKIVTAANYIIGFASLIITILVVFNLPDFLIDGRITDIFVCENNNEKYLTVWFTRTDHPAGIGDQYSTRLKSYNINSGKRFGRCNLVRRSEIDDYEIYGPFNNKAWGYSRKSGIQFLDLLKPKIIAAEKEILKLNPEMGIKIKIIYGDFDSVYKTISSGEYDYDSAYNPVSHSLLVYNEKGMLYEISSDLKAVQQKDKPKNESKSIKKNSKNWVFKKSKEKDFYFIHKMGTELSQESKVYLNPEIINGFNTKNDNTDKVWISYYTSIDKKAECMISYVNADGREIKNINIKDYFKKRNAMPFYVLENRNELLVFITSSFNTLSALQTDINTGQVSGKINYF